MPTLTPFEGKPVLSTTVAIRRAGDGLSAALKVDPEELHHGETVYVVLETVVEKIRFDPVKDADGFVRVHMLATENATIVDEAIVGAHIAEQKKRIREAAGEYELPLDPASDPEADPLGVHDKTATPCANPDEPCGHRRDAHEDEEYACLALDENDEPACGCPGFVEPAGAVGA